MYSIINQASNMRENILHMFFESDLLHLIQWFLVQSFFQQMTIFASYSPIVPTHFILFLISILFPSLILIFCCCYLYLFIFYFRTGPVSSAWCVCSQGWSWSIILSASHPSSSLPCFWIMLYCNLTFYLYTNQLIATKAESTSWLLWIVS